MGHKINPNTFRLGVINKWQSSWYSKSSYASHVVEDAYIRETLRKKFQEAVITNIYIERLLDNNVIVHVVCSRPGIIIGEKGKNIDAINLFFEKKLSVKSIYIDVMEVEDKRTNATLTAYSISRQITSRKPYKKVIRQVMNEIMAIRYIKGIKVKVSGRLNGAEIARHEEFMLGKVTLSTIRMNIDYCYIGAKTEYGIIGIKVWINKGEIFEKGRPSFVLYEGKNNNGSVRKKQNNFNM